MDRVSQYLNVHKEALELFKKKNKDYGDAFATFGPIGVIVRMGDKINRLVSVNNNGINMVNSESIRDTLIDLHNYSAMATMLLDERESIPIEIPRITELKKKKESPTFQETQEFLKNKR